MITQTPYTHVRDALALLHIRNATALVANVEANDHRMAPGAEATARNGLLAIIASAEAAIRKIEA
jgi:hypothetical protein